MQGKRISGKWIFAFTLIVLLQLLDWTLAARPLQQSGLQANSGPKVNTAAGFPPRDPDGGICYEEGRGKIPEAILGIYNEARNGAQSYKLKKAEKTDTLSQKDAGSGILNKEIRIWVKSFISKDCLKRGLCKEITQTMEGVKSMQRKMIVLPLEAYGDKIHVPGSEYQCTGTDERSWGDSQMEQGIKPSPFDSARVTGYFKLKYFTPSRFVYDPYPGYCDFSFNYVCAHPEKGERYSTPVTDQVTATIPIGTLTYQEKCNEGLIHQDISCYNETVDDWLPCQKNNATMVRVLIQWTAPNPAVAGSQSSDFWGEFIVVPEARKLLWRTCVDMYPYFEAYVQVEDEDPKMLFQISPHVGDIPASKKGAPERNFQGLVDF